MILHPTELKGEILDRYYKGNWNLMTANTFAGFIKHCTKSKFCAKRNRSKIYGLPLLVSSTGILAIYPYCTLYLII